MSVTKKIFVSEINTSNQIMLNLRKYMEDDEVVQIGNAFWKKVMPCRSNNFDIMQQLCGYNIIPDYEAVKRI